MCKMLMLVVASCFIVMPGGRKMMHRRIRPALGGQRRWEALGSRRGGTLCNGMLVSKSTHGLFCVNMQRASGFQRRCNQGTSWAYT